MGCSRRKTFRIQEPSMQDCLGANDRWAILKEELSENQIETPIAVCSKAEHP
jgi:hypothetical protein